MSDLVELKEEFKYADGQIWKNYDAYEQADRDAMVNQRHIDIRSLKTTDDTSTRNMLFFAKMTMSELENSYMAELSSSYSTGRGEKWTAGYTAPDGTNNNLPTLHIPLAAGVTASATSVIDAAYSGTPALKNHVTTPSFENGVGGWVTTPGGGFIGASGSSLVTTINPAIGSISGGSVGALTGFANGSGMTIRVPGKFKSGVQYTGSIYARTNAGPSAVQALYLGSPSTGDRTAQAITLNATWARYGIGWTPTADRTDVYFALIGTGPSGLTYYLDAAQVTQGVALFNYFDGDTQGYRWDGTPHLSKASGTYTTTIEKTDLLTGFDNTDHISISIPSWPSTMLLGSCFLDLTSNASGNFTTGPTASISFSASVGAAPVAGNPAEIRFNRSQLNINGVDLANITGVRLRLLSSAATTIKINAIRLLDSNWQYATYDVDTRYDRLRRVPPRNGNSGSPATFTIPKLWRSTEPSSERDPKPIDSEYTAIFNTGTITQPNSFTLYMRGQSNDFMTQLDLDSLIQADLNGNDQPDTGLAMYDSRVQRDLEVFTQDQLDEEVQFDLERTPDSISESWIRFTCYWTPSGANVSILNSEGSGFNIPLLSALSANTTYAFRARLEDNTARATIHVIDGITGNVSAKVFDSYDITDDFIYKRRKGRFGWLSNLADGDAYIESIRDSYTSFAEYRSLPLNSTTPVVGAELFVSGSPKTEHFSTLGNGPFAVTDALKVDRDKDRTTSGESWRITNRGVAPIQGIQTNTLPLHNFDSSRVRFDIFYQDSSSLIAVLIDDDSNYQISLPLPVIEAGTWQTVDLELPTTVLPGNYKLALIQPEITNSVWWIDRLSISTRTVEWYGRAVTDDPWMSNEAYWTPFKDNLNGDHRGILFPARGTELQVMGKALKQTSQINRILFRPKYATLGRLKPSEFDTHLHNISSSISFTYVAGTPAHSVVLTGVYPYANELEGSHIVNWEWTFGDGSIGYGPIVNHTYAAAGIYTVSLLAIDNYGNIGSYQTSVVVT